MIRSGRACPTVSYESILNIAKWRIAYVTMSDGRSSVTFAAPAAGISSQGTPESAGHGSRDTIVVSAGPAAVSQHGDAGVDQTMEARASSRSRAPSDEDDGRIQLRKSRKGEKSSFPRGSPSDPKNADQLRGAEMFHNSMISNKDGQIQSLRSQRNGLDLPKC